MQHFTSIHIILYVDNQQESTVLYSRLLSMEPSLNVPGMTEFTLAENIKLGLMPNKGIAKILGDNTPHPDEGNGIPRCELYYYVADIEAAYENAVKSGARVISPVEDRDWGDKACYFADGDGHIIAFAEKRNIG